MARAKAKARCELHVRDLRRVGERCRHCPLECGFWLVQERESAAAEATWAAVMEDHLPRCTRRPAARGARPSLWRRLVLAIAKR